MRIAFFGTPEPAVPALQAFLAAPDVDVPVVVTNPDRPRGRGHELAAPPVKLAAQAAGVKVWQPSRPREVIEGLAQLAPDACAVVAYGAILPAGLLEVPRHGFVNLHFSVLPAWRGAAPVVHTILAGEETTGVTCFVLDEGMDTGPVISQATIPVGPTETAGELTGRLAEMGAPMLLEAVTDLVAGEVRPEPQAHEHATYAPKISPDDARLDWSAPATVVNRSVRAFNPVPGAHTTFDERRLKVHRAHVTPDEGEPGTVLAAGDDGPVVACGEQALRLEEVQPAGKPRMSGGDFCNGYRPLGHRLGR